MTTIKELTAMCREGRTDEAYTTAKQATADNPDDVWAQRGMSWCLYYLMKADPERADKAAMRGHLDELLALTLLNPADEEMVFSQCLWKVAAMVKASGTNDMAFAQWVAERLRPLSFTPSSGMSALLGAFLSLKGWDGLGQFIEWWNLDNLRADDFTAFETAEGKKLMTLAERAYIAYSKALIASGDREKIAAWEPRMERFWETHPEMTYTGYFCGRLLLAMGSTQAEALRIVTPFAIRKSREFWVWQLLGEIVADDPERQLACLLRAAHCKTQECFLGKVRTRLVDAYLKRNDVARARHHFDLVAQCYARQGWHLPIELRRLASWPPMRTTPPDATEPVDYMAISDGVLSEGANESVAVVTYVDRKSGMASVVYGNQRKARIGLRKAWGEIARGMVLKIKWFAIADGIRVAQAEVIDPHTLRNIPYVKSFRGVAERPEGKGFAFVRGCHETCFIAPDIVSQTGLADGTEADFVVALDYDKKRETWNWQCVRAKKAAPKAETSDSGENVVAADAEVLTTAA